MKKGPSRELDSLQNHEIMVGDLLRAIMDPNLLELIFSKSSLLNVDEVISFITCLCNVSE